MDQALTTAGGPLPACCLDMDIRLIDLIFPAGLSYAGQEFVMAHQLTAATLRELQRDAVDMGNGVVKIRHRCAWLMDDGRCAIYDQRPQICRDFDCGLRSDCERCRGSIHPDSRA